MNNCFWATEQRNLIGTCGEPLLPLLSFAFNINGVIPALSAWMHVVAGPHKFKWKRDKSVKPPDRNAADETIRLCDGCLILYSSAIYPFITSAVNAKTCWYILCLCSDAESSLITEKKQAEDCWHLWPMCSSKIDALESSWSFWFVVVVNLDSLWSRQQMAFRM